MGALIAAGVAVVLLVTSTPALAHQPVQLTSADRTPASGPLLVDGTVSFAVYAAVRDRSEANSGWQAGSVIRPAALQGPVG